MVDSVRKYGLKIRKKVGKNAGMSYSWKLEFQPFQKNICYVCFSAFFALVTLLGIHLFCGHISTLKLICRWAKFSTYLFCWRQNIGLRKL